MNFPGIPGGRHNGAGTKNFIRQAAENETENLTSADVYLRGGDGRLVRDGLDRAILPPIKTDCADCGETAAEKTAAVAEN